MLLAIKVVHNYSCRFKTDTLELTAGTGITLTPDATNDKVTVSVALLLWINYSKDNKFIG